MAIFPTLLFLLFLGLKLAGFIAWSWVWITAPLWIGVVIFLGFLILGSLLYGLFFTIKNIKS
jgi:uncharacterized protein (DUF983 family)